ncbi:probable metal-nicotianamine transporter YSL7, partial [Olea europaea var. sylvestris]|uniref:probable metal-nicotianamine transporter YSL7 n=1 Tax=Olea europaea var. sylvestris TaxID=158386 RepID=UPI000C1CD4C7
MRERAGEVEQGLPEIDEGDKNNGLEVENAFNDVEVPPWHKQITMRAAFTSIILSFVFNIIVCKLNLTTGVIPSLNVAAGLLGFAIVKAWTVLLERCGMLKQPFTRQENTVIQTCVVASSGIAFSSGTASYLLGMSATIAAQADAGNTPVNVKKLSLGWIIGFLFIVSFVGLFSIVPLRKMMILKYKLTYPSGTATAYLINSFHTRKGEKLAKKQVMTLFKSFCFSFLFACFQWFFAAADGCGFSSFPTFGLQAFKQRFYFDFSSTYVGVGMICPYLVNVSLLVGAIVSWGIMWPLIESKKGSWYSADLSASSLHGIQGYRVFLAIAMMLGDGLFHVVYMIIVTSKSFINRKSEKSNSERESTGGDYDEKTRTTYFLKDQIPNYVAMGGYVLLAALSIGVVPQIFHQLKWYHILVAYVIAPVLAFCNAYGCGLTDWSLASNYGKVAILVFSAWVGLDHGGVLAGLACCGVMMSIVS